MYRIRHRLRAILLLSGALFGAICLPSTMASATTPPSTSASSTSTTTVGVDATTSSSQTRIRVATKPLEPFVMKSEAGEYTGFSVDLWNEIARRNNWDTDWRWNQKVTQVIDQVQQGSADVGIAGITINEEREKIIDFSQPMFNAGLQIAVNKKQKSGLGTVMAQIFSPRLLRLLAGLAIGIFLVGNLLWLTRYRRRAETRKYGRGLAQGVWVAGKTLGQGDFSDFEPRKPLAQILALLWMFAGIIAIQYFTALTTTQLTVQQISGSIQGVKDLPGKSIVTVDGSTADKWLSDNGIGHQKVTTINEAYPQLLDGKAEAIVYDSPVLLRWVATEGQGKARMVGAIFKPESYGIAMHTGSPLREQINRTLLSMMNDGKYDEIYRRWFQV